MTDIVDTAAAAPTDTVGGDTVRSSVVLGRRRLGVGVGTWAVVSLAGLAAPYLLSVYWLEIAVQGSTLGLLALSAGWLLRQSGLLSFGQAAFYGTSGYGAGIVAARTDVGAATALAVGILAGTVLAVVVALVIARTSGISFAMLTLAIGMLAWVATTRNRELTNGVDGLVVDLRGSLLGVETSRLGDPVVSWPIVWLVLMAAVGGLWLITVSPFGRTLSAIRENEERVRFAGISTFVPRLVVVVVAGFVASVAGGLSVLHQGFVSPENLFWSMSGAALIVAIIGGVGNVWGPPIGAIAYTWLQASLAESNYHQSIVGVLLIAVVVFAPGGITDLARAAAHRILGRGRA